MTPQTVDTDYLESVIRAAIVPYPVKEFVEKTGVAEWLDLRGVLLDTINVRFIASLLLPSLKPFLNDSFGIGGIGYEGLLLAIEMRSQLEEHAPYAQISYFGIAPALLDREAPLRLFGRVAPVSVLVTGVVLTGRSIEAAKRLVEIRRGSVQQVLAVVDRRTRATTSPTESSLWTWSQLTS